jgi:type II secretory pathway pseudopilin PulG
MCDSTGCNDRRRHEPPRRAGLEAGFNYIGLMILVAVTGVALAAAGEVWQVSLKREKEQELLFVGNQFRNALTLYYQSSAPQGKRFPMSLEDLLRDPRTPALRRYLRKIYVDPITGTPEWGLIKGPGGEIYGVHSLSDDEPVKKAGFEKINRNLEGKSRYSEWIFVYSPTSYRATPISRRSEKEQEQS